MVKTLLAVALSALLAAGCAGKDREEAVPKIKLPAAPNSETVDCENLTADDIEQCSANPDAKPICRAALKNCARLKNLQTYNKTLRDNLEGQ